MNLTKCDCCNASWNGEGAQLFEGDVICPSCGNSLGYCPTCELAQICPFETSSSPVPKVILKQIKQGNMVMQTQIKNPERIKVTCESECKCWNTEHQFCMKQDGFCANWDFRNKR